MAVKKVRNSGSAAGGKISVRCNTSDRIPWREIKPLQGNYKKRVPDDIQKLCRLIKKRGIRFPSFVSRIGKDTYGIDTHGRLLAYEELEKDGYDIPPIPVVYVDAQDKKEAKQLLLECDSRYGVISEEGFIEFISNIDINLNDLSLPDIDINLDDLSLKKIKENTENISLPEEYIYKEKTELIIECADEGEAETLYGEFKDRGLKCRISTL